MSSLHLFEVAVHNLSSYNDRLNGLSSLLCAALFKLGRSSSISGKVTLAD